MSAEAKVGAFTLGGAALLIAVIMFFGGLRLGGSQDYTIYAGFGRAVVKQIHMDAICRENICHRLCKLATVIAAIVTNNSRNSRPILKVLFKIVGKALCRHPNSVNIHAVCSSTHDASQPASSKFQVFVKTFYQLSFVRRCEHLFYFPTRFFIKSRCEPLFCFCFI